MADTSATFCYQTTVQAYNLAPMGSLCTTLLLPAEFVGHVPSHPKCFTVTSRKHTTASTVTPCVCFPLAHFRSLCLVVSASKRLTEVGGKNRRKDGSDWRLEGGVRRQEDGVR